MPRALTDKNIRDVKIVYVASAFSAPTPWGVHLNAQANERACTEIWWRCAGHVLVISPHQNARHVVGLINEGDVVLAYLHAVDHSDVVYVTGNWQLSSGTKSEIMRACISKIPIYFDMDDMVDYILNDTRRDKKKCIQCGEPIADTFFDNGLCSICLATAYDGAHYQPGSVSGYLDMKKVPYLDKE